MLLLNPAVTLMGRLRFSSKFLVTGAIFVLVLGYLASHSMGTLTDRLAQIRHERAGSQLIADLVHVNQALIEYRKTAILAPTGDESVRARLQALVPGIDAALTTLAKDESSSAALVNLNDRVGELKDSWSKIQQTVGALPLDGDFAQKAFSAHGKAFELTYVAMRDVGDRSGIALEPDTDLFYLGFALANNLPKLAGLSRRIEAYQQLNLRRGTLTLDDRVFYEVVDSRIKDALAQTTVMIDQSIAANPAIKARLADRMAAFKQANLDQLTFSRDHFIKTDRLTVTAADVTQGSAAAIAAAWDWVDASRQTFDAELAEREAAVTHQRLLLGLLAFGSALASIYLFAGMYVSIASAIRALHDGSTRLAGGDFRTPVRVDSADELGEVANSFNRMMSSLGALVTGIKRSATDVRRAADTLAATSRQIAEGSRAQATSAQATASAVEEVSASVKHVADNVVEAVNISEQAAHAAEHGRTVIASASAETRSVADLVGQLSVDVNRLGSRADEIGLIVNTIQGIADQTNLLALNAAIEAARAGEAGRGFAVVADEVRKLAENTRRSTEDIANMISKVQQDVKSSIAQAQASRERVLKGVEMTESATGSLDEIRKGSDATVRRIREISEASREQAIATEDIARNVERISQMSEDNDRAIEGISAAARQLQGFAADVERSVDAFRVA